MKEGREQFCGHYAMRVPVEPARIADDLKQVIVAVEFTWLRMIRATL